MRERRSASRSASLAEGAAECGETDDGSGSARIETTDNIAERKTDVIEWRDDIIMLTEYAEQDWSVFIINFI
jgi:hypothetical protein